MRYKIIIEYDGTCYKGWQKQENELTIQESLENALYNMFHKNIIVFGAGRTDEGVHAINQVAHFDLNIEYPCYKIVNGMNFYLREQKIKFINEINSILKIYNNHKFNNILEYCKQDIVIKSCEVASEEFDARFSAIERSYEYLIYNSFQPSALLRNRAWQIQPKLNLDKMNEACQIIIGKFDFSSFRASSCQAKTPLRTINNAYFLQQNENIISFNISAKSFLHHMVRNLVGTLKAVGTEKITVKQFQDILFAKDRTKAGITAPPYGLYFKNISY